MCATLAGEMLLHSSGALTSCEGALPAVKATQLQQVVLQATDAVVVWKLPCVL